MTTRTPLELEARSAERRRTRFAALVLAALIALFLSRALVDIRTHSYTAADLTQDFALTSLGEKSPDVGNRMLGDTVVEMQPWLIFAKHEFGAGRLPLWNPMNGAGVPQHANYQSAVFSPFSVPFYVLPFKLALLVSAALKLFALGLFTYLFLCEIELGFLPSIVGATAFAFSGLNVLLLGYPHAAVIAALPAGLYFVERAVRAAERSVIGRRAAERHAIERRAVEDGSPRELAFACLGLCATLVVGAYAGHPEPFVFALFAIAAWSALRCIHLAIALGRARSSIQPAIRLAALLIATGLLSAGLAAPQAIPFVEYLRESVTVAQRQPVIAPSTIDWWPLAFFPNALGAPLAGFEIAPDLPSPNYEQVNCSFAGSTVLLLAFVGLMCVRGDRRARFFGALAVVWFALTSNFANLGRAWDSIGWLGNFVPLSRSQPLWCFSLAVLAAIALERATSDGTDRARRAGSLAIVAVGAWMLASARSGAHALLAANLSRAVDALKAPIAERIAGEELWITISFAIAIAILAASFWIRSARTKRGLAIALLAIVFGQTGWLLRDYNPTTPDRYVFPRTPAIDALRAAVGDSRVVSLTDNALPPQTNMAYGISSPQVYDALGIARYETLYTRGFDATGTWRIARRAFPHSLELFGVPFVLTAGDWVPIGTGTANVQWRSDSAYEAVCTKPGLEIAQEFTCTKDRLSQIALFVSTLRYARTYASDLRVRLVDDQGATVVEEHFDPAELRRDVLQKREICFGWNAFAGARAFLSKQLVLNFEPELHSRGRRYRILIDCTRGEEQDTTIVWRSASTKLAQSRLTIDGGELAGALCFDYRTGFDPFVRVAKVGPFSLFRYAKSLGEYFAVSGAVEVHGASRALKLIADPRFDPYRIAVIERDPDSPVAAAKSGEPAPDASDFRGEFAHLERATRADVLERSPTRIRLRTTRATAGYLIACQSYFPGWRATVDGEPSPILCANYAFTGVAIPAGTSEVVLSYEPQSFRRGLWIALASFVIGATGLVRALRARNDLD